jgi:phosphatidate cytidylyltransferase
MLKRVITSIVGCAILLPILIFSGTFVLPIAITIVTLIGLYEMFKCIGMHTKLAMTLPAYFVAGILPTVSKLVHGAANMTGILCSIAMIYSVYLLAVAVILNKSYTFNDASLVFMASIYIIGGFLSIVFLREISDSIYLLVFIGAWITDIFAYFSGRLFGKHKLCETISPKKTIEGSIGGSLFCAAAFVIFALVTKGGESVGYYLIYAVVGLIISVVSQIGDLSMSLIKRHYKIKDFGKLFPGHGGILDRFDSVLAVALVLFIIFSTLGSFNIIIV